MEYLKDHTLAEFYEQMLYALAGEDSMIDESLNISDAIKRLSLTVSSKLKDVTDIAGDKLNALKDKIAHLSNDAKEALKNIKGYIGDKWDAAKERFINVVYSVEQMVKKNLPIVKECAAALGVTTAKVLYFHTR